MKFEEALEKIKIALLSIGFGLLILLGLAFVVAFLTVVVCGVLLFFGVI